MLANLSYTIPVIGRITIGDVVENERGKRLPIRLNHFRITSQFKRDGEWVPHPVQAIVASNAGVEVDGITEIPVKVMFNKPSLTIRERLEAYQDGRLTCASCAEGKAKRLTREGMKTVECLGPEVCEFANASKQGCDLTARINVQIDAEAEDCRTDEFSSFILRTRGYNSAKTIRQKLEMAAALFKGNLIGLPFVLKLRKKSTPISYNTPFYYVDLVLACSVMEGAQISKARAESLVAAGLNQAAFEESVEKGMANGPFEDTVEEMLEMEDLLIGSKGISESETGGMQDAETSGNANAPLVEPPPVQSTGIGLDVLRQFIEGTKTEGLVPA